MNLVDRLGRKINNAYLQQMISIRTMYWLYVPSATTYTYANPQTSQVDAAAVTYIYSKPSNSRRAVCFGGCMTFAPLRILKDMKIDLTMQPKKSFESYYILHFLSQVYVPCSAMRLPGIYS